MADRGSTGRGLREKYGHFGEQRSMIAIVDDDVVVARDWLEKLLGYFIREDVMAVTGNVLPLTLETPAEQWFEQYGEGGLGRGQESFEMNAGTFRRAFVGADLKLGAQRTWRFARAFFAIRRSGYSRKVSARDAVGRRRGYLTCFSEY